MRAVPKKTTYSYFYFYLGCLDCGTACGHIVEYYRFHLDFDRFNPNLSSWYH